MTQRKMESWVIPPEADAEFVAGMEDVLETSEQAYDPHGPVGCMAELPVHLVGATRGSIPASTDHPERIDYEAARPGTARIVRFAEPLSGFRPATARPSRTPAAGAPEVAHLGETRSQDTPTIPRVDDNLNTHAQGAFSEAFAPEKARDDVRRIQCGGRIELLDQAMPGRPVPRRLGHAASGDRRWGQSYPCQTTSD